MSENHVLYDYPAELRDLAYRIIDNQAPGQDRERRKDVALLLLKQATAAGLLEASNAILPKNSGRADLVRAKILSVCATYSGEAAAYYQRVLTEDPALDLEPPF